MSFSVLVLAVGDELLTICCRAKYIVIADGYLIDFKLKTKQTFHSRKKVYPLFGAYVRVFLPVRAVVS